MGRVPPGATFRHYKGKLYKIIQIGRHTEEHSLQVVYQALYRTDAYGDHPIWIRPLKMFLEKVTINGQEVPRFEHVH
ncbi:MAG: DUF1653 domain-containing protein [Verrucomicrobia bacterium]|nr:DUF1653 domain-containing protein [Verrucomicrobiota bacterium]